MTPVFPIKDMNYHPGPIGLTIRDYFAAKAMLIMWDAYDKGYCGLNNNDAPNTKTIANGAYQMADAMMEARKK